MSKRTTILGTMSALCGITIMYSMLSPSSSVQLQNDEPYILERVLPTVPEREIYAKTKEEPAASYEPKQYVQTEILEKEVDAYNKYNESKKKKNANEYNESIQALLAKSKEYIKIPYVWGGETRKGMDCSAFVRDLYSNFGYKLPRVSKDQSKVGKLVQRNELKPGDLLFFDTRSPRDLSDITTPSKEKEYAQKMEKGFVPNTVSHVGMYIGGDMMIHASSGHGYITEDSLDSNYFKSRFLFARRIIPDEY